MLVKAAAGGLWQTPRMSDSAFLERVKKRMAETGTRQADLWKALGLPSQSALSNIFNGKRRLTFNEALELERYLGMPRDDAAVSIPVIGLASASSWNEAVEMPIGRMAVPPHIAAKRAFAVEIKGDSLNRIVPAGGWVVVNPDERSLYAGKVYLIQNRDHEVTVKRYMNDPARFEPASTNPEHQPILMEEGGIQVIGRVTWLGSPL